MQRPYALHNYGQSGQCRPEMAQEGISFCLFRHVPDVDDSRLQAEDTTVASEYKSKGGNDAAIFICSNSFLWLMRDFPCACALSPQARR